jgi:hypothetical protein
VRREEDDNVPKEEPSSDPKPEEPEQLVGEPLSDIPEEPTDCGDSSPPESLTMWLQHEHPDLHQSLEAEKGNWTRQLESAVPESPGQAAAAPEVSEEKARIYRCATIRYDMYKDLMEIDSRLPLSYLTNQHFPDVPLYKGPYEASVELAFDPPMHRLVPGVPKDLPPKHVLIFKLTEQEEDARRRWSIEMMTSLQPNRSRTIGKNASRL